MIKFQIYEVWDVEQNKIFYVGKCMDIFERQKQHLKKLLKEANGPEKTQVNDRERKNLQF